MLSSVQQYHTSTKAPCGRLQPTTLALKTLRATDWASQATPTPLHLLLHFSASKEAFLGFSPSLSPFKLKVFHQGLNEPWKIGLLTFRLRFLSPFDTTRFLWAAAPRLCGAIG